MTYEIGVSRDRIASNDSSADTSEEFLTRHDLFAHEVTAAFSLDLVLNVHASNSSGDVLADSASDVGRATESRILRSVPSCQIWVIRSYSPSVGICNDGHYWVDAAYHLRSLRIKQSNEHRCHHIRLQPRTYANEIVQGSNSKIGLAKS